MLPHRVAAALAVGGVLALGPACADGPASPSGLMTFPGVRVERAPAAVPPPAAPAAAHARAYVDPASGRARERTQEDAAAEAQRDTVAPTSTAPQEIRGPNGIVGVRMNSRAAVYSVVTRTDDGRLVGECVQDSETHDAARHVRPAPAAHATAGRSDER